jgi:Holliday junction resolvase-like predicted endonuclease
MPTGFHPRRQGDLGEAAAIEWLTRFGACVAVPLFHSPDYDLIADFGNRLLRVQVKTSSCTHSSTDHFAVQLATSGGNQSWTGVVKTFDPARFDFLFVLVQDGRRWLIPSSEIEGRHSITVGGDKYSEFQVGKTAPLDGPDRGRSTLDSAQGGRRSRRAGPVCKIGASVLSGFDSHPPHFSPPSGGELRSGDRQSAVGRTKLSAHHQVAVPRAVAAASGIEPGDRFRVESDGPGRFLMTRIEEYMERHASQLALAKDAADA